jgi:hypothetical protein
MRPEKIKVSVISLAALHFAGVFELLDLQLDERIIEVVVSMNRRDNVTTFIPAIFLCQPPR